MILLLLIIIPWRILNCVLCALCPFELLTWFCSLSFFLSFFSSFSRRVRVLLPHVLKCSVPICRERPTGCAVFVVVFSFFFLYVENRSITLALRRCRVPVPKGRKRFQTCCCLLVILLRLCDAAIIIIVVINIISFLWLFQSVILR